MIRFLFLIWCLSSYFYSSACAMSPPLLEEEESQKHSSTSVIPLSSITSFTSLRSGIYESNNMEQILSFPLSNFDEKDLVIFDVDEVLITGLYHFANQLQKVPQDERLFQKAPSITNRFFLYMFLIQSYSLMERSTPLMIDMLQQRNVRCLANTSLCAIWNIDRNVNISSSRIEVLRAFNINFSSAFPHLPSWNFSAEEKDVGPSPEKMPVFKDGIIFSAETPKHITTLELLKKLNFKPVRITFIDDSPENATKMYEAVVAEGMEAYCFIYSRKKLISLEHHFEESSLAQYIKELENFLKRLVNEEEGTDEVFSAFQ